MAYETIRARCSRDPCAPDHLSRRQRILPPGPGCHSRVRPTIMSSKQHRIAEREKRVSSPGHHAICNLRETLEGDGRHHLPKPARHVSEADHLRTAEDRAGLAHRQVATGGYANCSATPGPHTGAGHAPRVGGGTALWIKVAHLDAHVSVTICAVVGLVGVARLPVLHAPLPVALGGLLG